MIRIVVLEEGRELGAGDFEHDHVRVGSAETNDLQVEDPAMAKHHMLFWMFNDVCNVRALGPHDLVVNGDAVADRAKLACGDLVTVGRFGFKVLVNPPDAAAENLEQTGSQSGVYMRSGVHVELEGKGTLDFSAGEEAAAIIEQAREVLRRQGRATPEMLESLSAGGVHAARRILQEANAHDLRDAAASAPAARREEAERPAASAGGAPATRLALMALLSLTALAATGGALYLIRELVLSFQE